MDDLVPRGSHGYPILEAAVFSVCRRMNGRMDIYIYIYLHMHITHMCLFVLIQTIMILSFRCRGKNSCFSFISSTGKTETVLSKLRPLLFMGAWRLLRNLGNTGTILYPFISTPETWDRRISWTWGRYPPRVFQGEAVLVLALFCLGQYFGQCLLLRRTGPCRSRADGRWRKECVCVCDQKRNMVDGSSMYRPFDASEPGD